MPINIIAFRRSNYIFLLSYIVSAKLLIANQRLKPTSQIIPLEERQLLHSIAEGDARAFRTLVDLHWRRVYGNSLTLLKSPQVAQEITQDIFLKIWTNKQRLKEVNSFTEYIYVVGRNQVLSALRKKVAKISEEPKDILEDHLVPDKQMQYKETYKLVMEGVERLTPQQQLIFRLSRLEGLSYMDIATKLNLSKNTVKGHMVLALNFLRTFVRDQLGHTVLFLAIWNLLSQKFFF